MYLIDHIEEILSQRPCIMDESVKRIKVVDIIFAFRATMLYRDLIQRGRYILAQNNSQLIKIENRINEKIKQHSEEYEIPVRAFVIF
jgi:hypothetical protein